MPVELRDIEIFLTLAEELHFGRTAQRLYLTPARVSQSIKASERKIGGLLVDRGNRRTVTLTPLGEKLRDELRPSFLGLRLGLERAAQAARGAGGVLRIGMINHNVADLRPFWLTFRERYPHWDVRVRHSGFIEPFEPLRRGDLDVLVTWLPVEEPDLVVGPVLFTEPQLLMTAVDSVPALRGTATLEMLADSAVPAAVKPIPDYWEDAYQPFYTPRGKVIERFAPSPVQVWGDVLAAVSEGEIMIPAGAHHSRYNARPGLVYLPVEEPTKLHWGLVWRQDADNPMVRAFAGVVRDLGTMEL